MMKVFFSLLIAEMQDNDFINCNHVDHLCSTDDHSFIQNI